MMRKNNINHLKTSARLIVQQSKSILLLLSLFFSQLLLAQEKSLEEIERINALAAPLISAASAQDPQQQSESAILKSLDNFDGELTPDIDLINNKKISSEEKPPLSSNQKGHILDELPDVDLIENSFDNLDIDSILTGSKMKGAPPSNQTLQANIEKRKLGVGVNGAEEALINKLDKSNLMDFDKNLDIWDKEVMKKKESLPDNVTDTSLEDMELIDEINIIDEDYLEDL